ncbi:MULTISPECIES: HDIG domain-containing metalloprotein [Exiguobacterium]|uniref:HD family phosphohydrolase n=1 Tax=Exiguobacterium sp. s128 TaxID=2751205 RepID=UPI00047CC10B|nr:MULTISPECIES: HDIG domain-containing metalloprotein [Exiguobacterium]MCT4780797.1 HDIG domain-containing protein [Exiguobacterium soli]
MRKVGIWIGLLTLGFYIIISTMMYVSVRPEALSAEPFSIAEEDIRSPLTIEDREATRLLKENTVAAIDSQYTIKQEYATQQIDKIEQLFAGLKGIKQAEDIGRIKQRLRGTEAADLLQDDELRLLATSSNSVRSTVRDVVITAIEEAMRQRISSDGGEVSEARENARLDIERSPLSFSMKAVGKTLTDQLIVTNYVYDPEKTEQLRKQTNEKVEPVLISEGEVIVKRGEVISQDAYRQLQLVGLISDRQSFKPLLGTLILSALMTILLFGFIGRSNLRYAKMGKVKLFSLVYLVVILQLIVTYGMAFLADDINPALYLLTPTAFSALVLRNLLNERIALSSTLFMALAGTFFYSVNQNFSFNIAIYLLVGGLVATYFLRSSLSRRRIFISSLTISAANIAVFLAFVLMRSGQLELKETSILIGFAIASGVLSAILAIGLLPFLEMTFGILAPTRLLELLNPTHPLLKKLLVEAPGTYHHSMMVANLAETACEAIGADGLLARVGAYYHDLGKTRRPLYFIENQHGLNPHDRLKPEESARVILAHTDDGVELLEEAKLPSVIVDICREHHGTSLLRYFYVKATEQGEVDEADFRYTGPKPQSREAAVIMIVDSIEAAVRSMKAPTETGIQELVKKIIREKLLDDQFSECDMTTRDIYRVGESACHTLSGLFHERIEYPELKKEELT